MSILCILYFYGIGFYGMVHGILYGMVYGILWYGIWYSMVWYMVFYGMVYGISIVWLIFLSHRIITGVLCTNFANVNKPLTRDKLRQMAVSTTTLHVQGHFWPIIVFS
jgi:hypothetical protein